MLECGLQSRVHECKANSWALSVTPLQIPDQITDQQTGSALKELVGTWAWTRAEKLLLEGAQKAEQSSHTRTGLYSYRRRRGGLAWRALRRRMAVRVSS